MQHANLLVVSVTLCCASLACDARAQQPFVNDLFACPSQGIVEPKEGYPYPFKQYPYEEDGSRSVAQLASFCQEMEDKFSNSNMSVAEAEALYAALDSTLTIRDESYGMPSPNAPPHAPVKIRERVAVRKLDDSTYELFFYDIGCGKNYSYTRAKRDENDKVQLTPIESWGESYPC